MAVFNAPVLGGVSTYTIDQSLRFNDDDSAYLSRTPASASNTKTHTLSAWVSLGNLGIERGIMGARNGSTLRELFFLRIDDKLEFYVNNGGTVTSLNTEAVFRDAASSYHILLAVDTTQATAADRVKIWVNGVQQSLTGSYPAQNTGLQFNNTVAHDLGAFDDDTRFFDGYLSEVHFIDGQALTPSDFGETDDTYGHWKPIEYTGTYGTNGFYLDFANSGDIGNDVSGNNNDWTPTNLAATDVVIDTPTLNFATLSPLVVGFNSWTGPAYGMSEGNLEGANYGTGGWSGVLSSWALTSGSGKWYWEVECAASAGGEQTITGIHRVTSALAHGIVGYTGDSDGYSYGASGSKFNNDTGSAYGSSWTTGDIIGIALDMSAAGSALITFYKNNVSQGVAFSGLSGDFIAALSTTTTGLSVMNFGQDSSFAGNKTAQGNTDGNGYGDFYYSPPSGYLALCNQNLPDPAVVPSEHFNTVLYTGNGGASSSQEISTVGFQPDFVWVKPRNSTNGHHVFDSVRTFGSAKSLSTNSTQAEGTYDALSGYIGSTDTDGFTANGGTSGAQYTNETGKNYVAWNWKANGSGSSNTDGSITSTVSANTAAGFSIVSYTGNGTAGATVGHGLGSVPELVIVKRRSNTGNWYVYHVAYGATKATRLDETAAAFTQSTAWNDTAPTSSVFSIGTSVDLNASGNTYIAYCFHSVDQFSKVFSYTGDGSADGSFVFCDFEPAWILIKRSDSTSNWTVIDAEREGYNVDNDPLYPNLGNAEGTTDLADIVSNGFKLRTTDGSVNASGGTYIGIAFAKNALKHGNAR